MMNFGSLMNQGQSNGMPEGLAGFFARMGNRGNMPQPMQQAIPQSADNAGYQRMDSPQRQALLAAMLQRARSGSAMQQTPQA